MERTKIEKERKTIQLKAGVCSLVRSVFLSHFRPLLPVAISSREGTIPALSLGFLFVLSHSLRSGEHELPYSDATCENQLKQMTSAESRRHSNYGCLVKVAFFRSSLLITIDTQQRAIDDEVPDRDCLMLLHFALPGAILLGRRGTTLSADKKDVGDALRGKSRGAARVTAIV